MAEAKKPSVVSAAKVERAVQKWAAEHLHNTAFSQDTAAWNVLQGALPKLVPAIIGELG